MLNITKQGNSIKVVGVNNPTYPYSGTLTYPLNSIILVVDSSNMATFRSVANNDVLFTGIITDITINGTPQTKETIGQQFGAISNASTGGGGTGGGAVDSVNGQTGTVVLTAGDVNAYSKAETDEKLRDYTPLEAYATEIASIKKNMGNKADKSSLDNYLLKTDAQTNYQAKLTAGTGIEITGENVINVTLDTNIYQVVESLPDSNINPNKIYLVLNSESGESDLYIEYLYVNNKWEKIGEYKADVDLTPYLKSSEAASTYATKQELAGEVSEREKQDSALGGMIAGETEAREQAITNLTATVQGKLDTATYNEEKATFALKTEIPDTSNLATKTELSEGLAGKANTSDLSNYLTTANAQSTYATKSELGAKLDVETYNSEKATFALKSEIPTDYLTSDDLAGYETTEHASATYQPKGEYLTSVPEEYITETELEGKGYATKTELNGKANLDGAEFTGNVAVPDLSINDSRDGVMFNVSKQSRDILFRTMNAGIDSVSFQVQSAYPLKLTEAGIMENNVLLETKYAKVDDIPTDYITNEDLTPYETKENAQATYQIKGEYATAEQVNAKQDTLISGTNIKTINSQSILGSGDITIEGGTGSGVKEWDFAQLQSDNETRNNFITNAKASDIVNNVSYQSTTYDHCSILCIKGSTYSLLLNNDFNPMIAPLTVVENSALISAAINIYTIVDSVLSDDSTNPVQNKVIKAELDKMANARKHDLSTYGGLINAGDTLTNVGSYGLSKVFVCVYSDILNIIAIGLNADGNDIVINLKNENVEGTWKWNVKSEIEIGGGTGTSYTEGNGINISEANEISVDTSVIATVEALNTLTSRVAALEAQIGEISAKLDAINGETV